MKNIWLPCRWTTGFTLLRAAARYSSNEGTPGAVCLTTTPDCFLPSATETEPLDEGPKGFDAGIAIPGTARMAAGVPPGGVPKSVSTAPTEFRKLTISLTFRVTGAEEGLR